MLVSTLTVLRLLLRFVQIWDGDASGERLETSGPAVVLSTHNCDSSQVLLLLCLISHSDIANSSFHFNVDYYY